jgi:hypothetical protein
MDRTEIAAALADTPAARAAAVPPPPRPTAPSEPPPAPLSEESSQPETADAAEALVEKRALEYVPEPPAPEPLPTDAHDFWAGGVEAPGAQSEVRIPTIHAALSKRLGGFSFWRGEAGCDALISCASRKPASGREDPAFATHVTSGRLTAAARVSTCLQRRCAE